MVLGGRGLVSPTQDFRRRFERPQRRFPVAVVSVSALVATALAGASWWMLSDSSPSSLSGTTVTAPSQEPEPYIVEIPLPAPGTGNDEEFVSTRPNVVTSITSSKIESSGTSANVSAAPTADPAYIPGLDKAEVADDDSTDFLWLKLPSPSRTLAKDPLDTKSTNPLHRQTASNVENTTAKDRAAAAQKAGNLASNAATTTTGETPTASELLAGFGQPKHGPVLASVTRALAKPEFRTLKIKVKSGDSLYSIFKSRGISGGIIPSLIDGPEHGERLKSLRPGQAIELHLDGAGKLAAMDYKVDRLTTVSYSKSNQGFESALLELQLERVKSHASGVIKNSLFLDAQRVGLSNRVIMRVAEIFGWDLDFAHDLRKGDRFTVVYEELFHEGKKVGDGEILAAEFVNRGAVYRAVRFVDPKGQAHYFTPEGLSMRKAFLRAPVKFGRISSRFNLKRRHPILHKIRAHRGVDYAAKIGTPVYATGNGRVELAGNKRGYGKTVVIRHGQAYTTLYAHLHKYARGMHSGKAVKQGQLIGYVGKTGLATGPHVHYEFRVRGVHKDPLRVKLPKASPITAKLRREFRNQTDKLVTMLDVYGASSVASR